MQLVYSSLYIYCWAQVPVKAPMGSRFQASWPDARKHGKNLCKNTWTFWSFWAVLFRQRRQRMKSVFDPSGGTPVSWWLIPCFVGCFDFGNWFLPEMRVVEKENGTFCFAVLFQLFELHRHSFWKGQKRNYKNLKPHLPSFCIKSGKEESHIRQFKHQM